MYRVEKKAKEILDFEWLTSQKHCYIIEALGRESQPNFGFINQWSPYHNWGGMG